MQIMDILDDKQAANLGRAFNLPPDQAAAAIHALVPALKDHIERNTLSRGGLADFVAILGERDRSNYLSDAKSLAAPDAIADGNSILEEVLGSKDMSRKVAERAARQTGLNAELLKSLLPAVAAMTVGGLAKGAGGALGQVMQRIGVTDGNPLRMPGQTPARPPLPQGKSPLPIPGDDLPGLGRNRPSGRNPLDDLSDILRRGGRGFPGGGGQIELPRPRRREVQVPGGEDDGRTINIPGGAGGSLWDIVRSILGSVLGFQNKGFLSWLIQLIVFKWGIGFLRRILTRVLTGR